MGTEKTGGTVELASGVYWVGAIDWNGRDFHGFSTPGGTSYNSYLVAGEKTALIDTVKAPFAGEVLRRITRIIDPSKLDYIVVNHMEPDHAGFLAELKKQTDAKVFITRRGADILNGYFRDSESENWNLEIVKTGDELDLGGKTLMFLEATMLHWPDSMETFLKEDRILFSNNGFGQHVASSKRYDFEVGDVLPDAAEYYANTLMPFHMPLLRFLGLLDKMRVEPLQIAPSHGVIWKQDLKRVLEAYRAWANGEVKEKVLVIYDTMWGSTEIMANEIAETVRVEGVEVKVLNLQKNSRSHIMKEMLDAAAFAVGSPTLNNGIFPTVGDFLVYLKGLRPQKKKAVAFGSYGWGGGGVKAIEQGLKDAGIGVLGPGLQVRYRPYGRELERCRKLGEQLAAVAKDH
jgi:flavorubredoxin